MSSLEETLTSIFNFIGSLVCHQMPERTFQIGGNSLPVCARDTGVYIGFLTGYPLVFMSRKGGSGPPNPWFTLSMALPMMLDALTQFFGLRTSTNELRLITGLLFGTSLSPFMIYLLSLVPLSRRVPILKGLLPSEAKIGGKDPWLSAKALSFGLAADLVLFLLIEASAGSTSRILYWLYGSLIIFSIIWHTFLLPTFLLIAALHHLKEARSMKKIGGDA